MKANESLQFEMFLCVCVCVREKKNPTKEIWEKTFDIGALKRAKKRNQKETVCRWYYCFLFNDSLASILSEGVCVCVLELVSAFETTNNR